MPYTYSKRRNFRKYSNRKVQKICNVNITLLEVSLIIVFLVVFLRLFYIQIIKGNVYADLAQGQYSFEKELPAMRGDILSSDGEFLAGTRNYYLFYAEPRNIEDKDAFADKLAPITFHLFLSKDTAPEDGLNKEASLNSASKNTYTLEDEKERIKGLLNNDRLWIALAKGIPNDMKRAIEELNLPFSGFEDFPMRTYPKDYLASHVLGFLGKNAEGEPTGYFGIEGAFNLDLKGVPGKVLLETDAFGKPMLMGNYKKIPPVRGRDVVLTINRTIQFLVEQALEQGVKKYDASSGSVIVMNPYTGDIIAMATYPKFSLDALGDSFNKIWEDAHRKPFESRNLCIADVYEPGSVMKPLTVATAIDLGIITPETTFEDNGPVTYSGYTIDNWDGKHHGTQNIVQLLQKSNNIGASWVGHKVGATKLYRYFKKFGLGSPTGVMLQGEDTGLLRPASEWTDIDLATISFGQGISVTPLQMLNAFNVFANGGVLMRPRIVLRTQDPTTGISSDVSPKVIRRVISKETADTMVYLLEQAAEGGEAKYFVNKRYRIAGKTGTAQIPENGKYDPKNTNATFVGFILSEPRFTMIVRLEKPRASTYASETAVPVWMNIASELVKFYGIPPDRTLQ